MTEMVLCGGTSRITEGKPTVTDTHTPVSSASLAGLDDAALIAHTHGAWVSALTLNAFDQIRACQAEALRRGKPHLYDQAYIAFWLGTASSTLEAA